MDIDIYYTDNDNDYFGSLMSKQKAYYYRHRIKILEQCKKKYKDKQKVKENN